MRQTDKDIRAISKSSGSLERIRREKKRQQPVVFQNANHELLWLEDQISELEVFISDFEGVAAHLEDITVRSNGNFLHPTRMQRLSDAGRSRMGSMEMRRAAKALQERMDAIAKHEGFEEEAISIVLGEPQEFVAAKDAFSRAKTRLQLRQQAIALRQTGFSLKTLLRNMKLYKKQIETEQKIAELNEKLLDAKRSVDKMVESIRQKEKEA